MANRKTVCGTLLAWVLLLGFGSLAAAQDYTIGDSTQQLVQSQQQQNTAAQQAAVNQEQELVNAGNQAFQAKEFTKAADDYRRALNITYNQWTFNTMTANGMQSLQPTNRQVQMRLSTQNTKMARDRLNSIPGAAAAEDQATFEKKVKALFEQADTAMLAKKPPEAYEAYEEIIALADAQGEKKYALEASKKASDAEKKILADAGKPLDEVEKAIAGGDLSDATAKLASYKKDYAALMSVALPLKKRFDQLQASPAFKKRLQEQEAQTLIDEGDLETLREDYTLAVRYYRKAAALHPDTAAAAVAVGKLTQLRANPKAADALKQEAAETK